MKVSLNTIKQYVNIDLGVDDLVEKINMQLGGVEEVVDLSTRFKNAVIVKVFSCEKHSNADKLSVCLVDDGGTVSDVERNEDGLVQVVCGAPNARADMFAVWLPPNSTVPASFDDDQPFVLDAREIRGVMSNGMLAAGDELGINNDHNGIVDITEEDLPAGKTIKPGDSFAQVFSLDDTVIDIENKMFTHRPDCFGQLGVAREIFAITAGEPVSDKPIDIRFPEEDWYWQVPKFENSSGIDLIVEHEAGRAVSRFMTVAFDGVEVKSSPLWLQTTLLRWGSKSINSVVDLTNYIMLLTGQPTHAYDYDKLHGGVLGVRMAKNGEKAELLNGKTYELSDEDIVIFDGEGVVGLGGVMGGLDSEVTVETTRVVLEVATFDMYTIRKTSMRHGLFTDAVTRFNKGQSPLQNSRVMKKLIGMMPGRQASDVYDESGGSRWVESDSVHPALNIRPSFINQRLGLDLSSYAIGNILRRVNFAIYTEGKASDETLSVTAPFWRTDIVDNEDLVEEVGRLFGFDKLPVELPRRSIVPAAKNSLFEVKRKIRQSLAKSGANEVLTYSFVHENIFQKSEQDMTQAFRLSNALSPDLQYYRLSVLPSLLEKVHPNIKSGHDEFALFEIGKGHNKKYHLADDDGLPKELQFVDMVYASKKPQDGAAFYRIRKIVESMAADLGFSLRFRLIDEVMDYPVTAPFDQSRSAIVESDNGDFVGMIGELKSSVVRKFKLPEYVAVATLDLEGIQLSTMAVSRSAYRQLSRFPKSSQDISLKVAATVNYSQLYDVAERVAHESLPNGLVTLSPISIYQASGDIDHKTITFHLELSSYEKTLTADEVSAVVKKIADQTARDFGAILA